MSETPNINFETSDGYLIVPKEAKINKKITGRTFSMLAGANKFSPKGDGLLTMWGLLKDDIDPFYSLRGEVAEHIVKQKLENEGYTIKTWDKGLVGYDNFPSSKEFGGLIDMAIVEPFREVVEVKSKNINSIISVNINPIKDNEYQAMYYGFLSKSDARLMYIFFTDEQEEKIRAGTLSDFNPDSYEYYTRKLMVNRELISRALSEALEYRNKCREEMRIPLDDISKRTKTALGI